jgi:hypothetical protein
MADLLRTRCTAGWLVITDEAVRIERAGGTKGWIPGAMAQMMPRAGIVGATINVRIPAIFGQGGGSDLTFTNMGGMVIVARTVKPRDAQEALRLLGYA